MGECIICGAEVEGADICAFHEEDVLFTFSGNAPDQLVEGRFYEGTVDGIADFGVFVDLGNGVTGLLHRNQLDRRLESLGWDVGDTVYVQVTGIADSGEVDLGPSIRQSPAEFRGTLEQGPGDGPAPVPTSTTDEGDSGGTSRPRPDLERSQIRSIDRYFGREVLLEGRVEDIRQTGGPTVFTLRDESGTVECAAFAGAGVRAYPQVEDGDIVRVRGVVEHRFDEHQIEVEHLDRLGEAAATAVLERVADGELVPSTVDTLPLLYDDPANLAIETEIREVAAALRRAVEREVPVRIRHPVTVDGYVAAAALERAIETVAPSPRRDDVERVPIDDPVYDMEAVIEDVLEAHPDDDERPFVVLVGAGSDGTATAAYDLLETYDVEYAVVDTDNPEPAVLDRVDALVNPWCGEGTYPIPSTTAVACNLAGLVAEAARDDLRHLPAVASADPPGTAGRLLEDSRYDRRDIETMRQAITIEAFYQPWEDKRALVRGILFDRSAGSVEPISEQFRRKLDRAVEVADHNADRHDLGGTAVIALDVERYGNRFEFPPVPVLLRGLLDADGADADVAVGIGRDAIDLVALDGIDLHRVAADLDEAVPDAGVTLQGGQSGRIRFVAGRRDDVSAAAIDAVTAAASSA